MEVGTPQQRAEDALGFYEEGFRAIKLRLHHDTLEEDIALARAVKDAVGDRMELMADGNQAQTAVTPSAQPGVIWDQRRALYTARALEEMGFVWLEEPLSRYDFDGLARLNAATGMAIAGGENNRYLHEFHWMLERGLLRHPAAGRPRLRGHRAAAQGGRPRRGAGQAVRPPPRRGRDRHLRPPPLLGQRAQLPLGRADARPPGRVPLAGAARARRAPSWWGRTGTSALPAGPGLGIEVDEAFVKRYAG